MSLRRFASLLLVLALWLGLARPAGAQELRELPGASVKAPAPAPAPTEPALTLPHDMPVVLSRAQVDVPPVPATYVTKDLGWLKLSYPAAAAERVASIVRDADAVKTELSYALAQPVLDRVEVRVAPTVADMARLAPANAPPPEYASGVAYSGTHLVLLSMLAPRGADAVDLDEVFRHEMAHVALEDAVRGNHVPVWFNEGLAIGLSGEQRIARERTLWSATLSGTLLPFADLDRSFPRDTFEVNIAYAESADFLRFLRQRSDHLRFTAMIERVRDGVPFDRALSDAYGADLRKLEFQWRSEVERRYSVIPILTGGGLVWVLVIGGLGYAYVRKRRRAKAILARWEKEEALEDALRAERDADDEERALLRLARVPAPPPKVEHDGRWHTLH